MIIHHQMSKLFFYTYFIVYFFNPWLSWSQMARVPTSSHEFLWPNRGTYSLTVS